MSEIKIDIIEEVRKIPLVTEFKKFLTASNALALAIGFIIGTASKDLVTAVVNDLIMPVVGMISPSKADWQSTQIPLLNGQSIKIGDFLGSLLNFIIIAFVVFMITKLILRPDPEAPTQVCPFCKETVPADATKCKYCTSELTATA